MNEIKGGPSKKSYENYISLLHAILGLWREDEKEERDLIRKYHIKCQFPAHAHTHIQEISYDARKKCVNINIESHAR
jgi:hypothetical protein